MPESTEQSQPGRSFWCPSTCFTLFLVVSLLTHIAELFLNAVHIWYIQTNIGNPAWTATTLGFLLLPLVLTQLFSAILYLQRKEESSSRASVAFIALTHVFQFGFIWRHLNILQQRNPLRRKTFLVDLLLLRLVFAFTSGLPMLCLQAYSMVKNDLYHGIQIASMVVCLVSTSWALASFRRQNESCDIEKVILTWPGILFKLLWRSGEITARILSLALFASSYEYWTFLVIGLHWVTMLICIWAAILGTVSRNDFGRISHAMICLAIGYIYTFTHLNFSSTRSKCRYISYYVIIFLETCVLVVTWILYTPLWREDLKSVVLLTTVLSAFFLCIVSMTFYYGCFHVKLSNIRGNKEVCVNDGCINCKLSLCTKHSQVLQRPFNAGWTNQYQSALYSGQYYRNVLQDSLLDSASELEDRCHGNVSFNDREVERIMDSNLQEIQTVQVHSPSEGADTHLPPITQDMAVCQAEPRDNATLSATSTIKSSLDLYNNLNNVQSDKSYYSPCVLRDKTLVENSLNTSLLKMDSEFWVRDGASSQRGLGGYNLQVSSIGENCVSRRSCTNNEIVASSTKSNIGHRPSVPITGRALKTVGERKRSKSHKYSCENSDGDQSKVDACSEQCKITRVNSAETVKNVDENSACGNSARGNSACGNSAGKTGADERYRHNSTIHVIVNHEDLGNGELYSCNRKVYDIENHFSDDDVFYDDQVEKENGEHRVAEVLSRTESYGETRPSITPKEYGINHTKVPDAENGSHVKPWYVALDSESNTMTDKSEDNIYSDHPESLNVKSPRKTSRLTKLTSFPTEPASYVSDSDSDGNLEMII